MFYYQFVLNLLSSTRDRESQLLMEGSMSGYFARLEESGWLRHVRLILMAGVVTAEKLHFEGSSVLVHCSDGWYAIIFVDCLNHLAVVVTVTLLNIF